MVNSNKIIQVPIGNVEKTVLPRSAQVLAVTHNERAGTILHLLVDSEDTSKVTRKIIVISSNQTKIGEDLSLCIYLGQYYIKESNQFMYVFWREMSSRENLTTVTVFN